jgi:hypothetical protein
MGSAVFAIKLALTVHHDTCLAMTATIVQGSQIREETKQIAWRSALKRPNTIAVPCWAWPGVRVKDLLWQTDYRASIVRKRLKSNVRSLHAVMVIGIFFDCVTDLTALRYRACNTSKSLYYYAKVIPLAVIVRVQYIYPHRSVTIEFLKSHNGISEEPHSNKSEQS